MDKLPNMRTDRQYPIDRIGGLFVLAQFLFFLITAIVALYN